MKYILLVVGLFVSNLVFPGQSALQDLSELTWENRIILIFSANEDSNDEQLFAKYDEQIKDRDVIWFILKDKQVITNYPKKLSTQFIDRTKRNFSNETNNVLLIGKDGDIKLRANQLNLNFIFEKIDSMPMRQQEVKFKR